MVSRIQTSVERQLVQQKMKIPFLMLTIILVIFTVLSSIHHRSAPKWIHWENLEIANGLVHSGTFTDGGTLPNNHPGNAYPPAYPALIASLSLAAPALTANLQCLVEKLRKCQQRDITRTLVALQFIASLITLLLVYSLAWEISHSNEISILTLILFMFSGGLAKFSQSIVPFVFITLFVMASSYLLLLAFSRQSNLYAFLAGIFSAIAALFFPPFALSLVFISIAFFIANKTRLQPGLIPALTFLFGACLVLGPWILRNQLLLNEIAITHNSSLEMLARRVAYNDMSVEEWLASFILGIPLIGTPFSELLFSPNIITRLGYDNGSISGNYPMIINSIRTSAQGADTYTQMVSTYIANDIYRYASSIPPLFIRSIWGGSTIALFGISFLWPLGKRLLSSHNTAPFALVFTCLVSYVLTQSLLSAPNFPHHYNGHILFIYAYAIAHVSGGLEIPKILRAKPTALEHDTDRGTV